MTNNLDVDSLCEAFEYACQNGNPKIEVFLKRFPDESRAELLRELIQIELWWRRRESPPPSSAEFEARFPDDAATVSEAFRLFQERSIAAAARSGLSETASFRVAFAQTVIREENGGSTADHGLEQRSERHQVKSGEATSRSGGEVQLPRVPGYEVTGILGRGGMGVVYDAIHQDSGNRVALKMMLKHAANGEHDLSGLLRFRLEAEAVSSLKHPNIVKIVDIGVVSGVPFLVLEFLERGTLADDDRIRGRELLPVLTVFRRITLAVAHAHSRGIIHRDLKPTNVLIAEDGTPKVSDFGLSKFVRVKRSLMTKMTRLSQQMDLSAISQLPEPYCHHPDGVRAHEVANLAYASPNPDPSAVYAPVRGESVDDSPVTPEMAAFLKDATVQVRSPVPRPFSMTSTGEILGTPRYMAPEQLLTPADIGPHSDVFSLGCVLYYLLTGAALFDATSLPEYMMMMRSGEPPTFSVEVPELVRPILTKCLSFPVAGRYRDAAELAVAVRAASSSLE